jgi:hypothetical protein
MSSELSTETSHLVGPEYSTEAPCPTCHELILIDGIMFVADGEEGEVHETCHWCEQPYVVRRRTHFVGYTLISHATLALVHLKGQSEAARQIDDAEMTFWLRALTLASTRAAYYLHARSEVMSPHYASEYNRRYARWARLAVIVNEKLDLACAQSSSRL